MLKLRRKCFKEIFHRKKIFHLTISACFSGQLDRLTAVTTNTVKTGSNISITSPLSIFPPGLLLVVVIVTN